jgi:hypothetical protein
MRSLVLRADDLTVTRFRAARGYEIVARGELGAAERQGLQALASDPDFHALLRPRRGGATIKLVDRRTTALLRALARPGIIPRALRGKAQAAAIERLVLDGIIEIERDDVFVTGAAARIGSQDVHDLPRGVLAALSRDAIRYAADLQLPAPLALSERLYFFNRVPATERHRRALREASAAIARRIDQAGWRRRSGLMGWQVWSARFKPPRVTRSCKLYVSPRPEATAEAAAVAAAVLAEAGAFAIKIGEGAYGLLRPDKFVAYFTSFADLTAGAATLRTQLAGCPVQGVPFTAELDPSGLISWGIDPPHEANRLAWEGGSWRRVITDRLALALIAAQTAGLPAPWRHALDRLALSGIDPHSWTLRADGAQTVGPSA